jgi:hypothetical protein
MTRNAFRDGCGLEINGSRSGSRMVCGSYPNADFVQRRGASDDRDPHRVCED